MEAEVMVAEVILLVQRPGDQEQKANSRIRTASAMCNDIKRDRGAFTTKGAIFDTAHT